MMPTICLIFIRVLGFVEKAVAPIARHEFYRLTFPRAAICVVCQSDEPRLDLVAGVE